MVQGEIYRGRDCIFAGPMSSPGQGITRTDCGIEISSGQTRDVFITILMLHLLIWVPKPS